MENELKIKIEECNRLHEEIEKRPFIIKDSCNFVAYPKNITKSVKDLKLKMNDGKELYVNANYKNATLTVVPIKEDEQIFYGLVVVITNKEKGEVLRYKDVKRLDFVSFQVCDIYDITRGFLD